MSYLIFCSFEVGGQPFRMAETLNRFGVETYYVYVGPKTEGHDTTEFHYGKERKAWNLSDLFEYGSRDSKAVVKKLGEIKLRYNIMHCLATGYEAYLLQQAGIPYLYWSYGSDLDQQCFMLLPFSCTPLWKRLFLHHYRVWRERQKARTSIRFAGSVMISPYQIEALAKVGPDKKMFFLPHYFKLMDYERLLEEKRKNKKALSQEIQEDRFFFSSARHIWSGPLRGMSDRKGNDVILHAYSRYLKLTGDFHSKLVLIKKGPDVESSRALSKKLRIEENLVWADEVSRDQLDRYYQGADLCFGQFGTPVLTYAVLEPLSNACVGVSQLSHEEQGVPFYREAPPIFNSKQPDEIAHFMAEILNTPNRYSDLGYQSWQWIKENCSEEKFVNAFITLFKDEGSPDSGTSRA